MFYFAIVMVIMTVLLSILALKYNISTSTYQEGRFVTKKQIDNAIRMTEDSARWNHGDEEPAYCYSKGLACIQNEKGDYEMVDQLSPSGTGVFLS